MSLLTDNRQPDRSIGIGNGVGVAVSVGGLAPEKVAGTEARADEAGSEVQRGSTDGTCCKKRRADGGAETVTVVSAVANWNKA